MAITLVVFHAQADRLFVQQKVAFDPLGTMEIWPPGDAEPVRQLKYNL
jgi:hypothetical protein